MKEKIPHNKHTGGTITPEKCYKAYHVKKQGKLGKKHYRGGYKVQIVSAYKVQIMSLYKFLKSISKKA